jgi:hypothetical protein
MQYNQCGVNPECYPRRNEKLVWRDVAGEVVIADRNNGTIRTLNKTASVLWTLADGSKNINDLAASICERYEVSEKESVKDSIEFCQQLVGVGILTVSETVLT